MVNYIKKLLLVSAVIAGMGTAVAMEQRPLFRETNDIVFKLINGHYKRANKAEMAEYAAWPVVQQNPQKKDGKSVCSGLWSKVKAASGAPLAKIKKILKWSGIVIASGCLLDWLVLDPVIPPVITVPVMVGGGVCYLVLYHC